MQEHLHIGRSTWKRTRRTIYIWLAVILPFVLVLGMPYMRLYKFDGGACYFEVYDEGENYLAQPGHPTPLIILVPWYEYHKDIHGLHWIGHIQPKQSSQ